MKCAAFRSLESKVKSRIVGWKENLFSTGGREVLLKAVATTIPIYQMGCLKFPKTTYDRFNAMLARYWWRGQHGKGIHWCEWDQLAEYKEKGGLEFKDIKCLNIAFLAKLSWKLSNSSNALRAQNIAEL
ncbi:hypothetical protein Scep_012601 [Stephania cephalantha]|uniref:Uncharacterized protein n=1 Tax=Stephania cephalantha TaxID=152367 RepID=A0AAP0P6U5_9MAGN